MTAMLGKADVHPTSALILVAEDGLEMRQLLRDALEQAGYRVAVCRHGLDLLAHLTDPDATPPLQDIALVITDIRMPGVNGMEVVCGLRHDIPLPPVLLITAFGDRGLHLEAERLGIRAVLDKPFDVDVLLATVREIIEAPPVQPADAVEPTDSAPADVPGLLDRHGPRR